MTLQAGYKMGVYEILSPLGAGGMGEVYRARDTRLDRTVAIKVLPAHLAGNAELRQRFEREARAVSSLNHPHICALYDVGSQEGTDYLVLEFVEGQTLAERLRKGALPVDETLRYAIQIADALDKAHRNGVVHRDLKPGNVMLTKSGAKLLDFGLAKLRPPGPGAAANGLSALPTENRELTGAGTVLGTFQYMSPEQLEGGDADARTDIFAFGALVYEMATGRKAFSGKSHASLISAIMNSEPPAMSTLQPLTPPALEHVVKKCLAKDPDDRWQTAHDLGLELAWIAEAGAQAASAQPVTAPHRDRERLAWAVAAVAVLLAAVLAVPAALWLTRKTAPEPAKVTFNIEGPNGTASPPLNFNLSPDGRRVVMVRKREDGKPALWHRALENPEGEFLRGTDNGALPFWSPDSRFVAFFADGKLKKVDLLGSPPEPLGDAPGANSSGAWNTDGTIVYFASFSTKGPLLRITARGGQPAPITALDASLQETAHVYPCFLPDGRHFLYLALSALPEKNAVYIGSLDSRDRKRLMPSDSKAVYAPPGYLLFQRGSTLMAQHFDSRLLELQGESFLLATGVAYSSYNGGFCVSNRGVLAYIKGGDLNQTQLSWVDRTGKEIARLGSRSQYIVPMLSPAGDRVAVGIGSADTIADIFIFDVARGFPSKFTGGPGANSWPVWSPDGDRIVFASNRDGGTLNLYIKSASGAGQEELLRKSERRQRPTTWSPDGRHIVYQEDNDLWVLPLTGDLKPYRFPGIRNGGRTAQFSPDGRWLAYASEESGQREIYVQTFPASERRWQISTAGGASPFWRRDGKELFFWSPDGDLMALDVLSAKTDTVFKTGLPHALFRRPVSGFTWGRLADTMDGQRFLVNSRVSDAESSAITIVLNWTAALKK